MNSPGVTIVVMGDRQGCGKTTVGTLLAQRLGVPYLEADNFRSEPTWRRCGPEPRSPTRTGSHGSPRSPGRSPPAPAPSQWSPAPHSNASIGTSCARPIPVCDLHLVIDEAAASQRVAARPGHFMRASLVPSQLADLSPLQADHLAVDATHPPEDIVTAAMSHLTAQGLLAVPA